MLDLLIGLGLFVFLLFVWIVLKKRFLDIKKIEINNTDIILILIPIILWLLLTGKISKLEIGDLKIQTAFIEASVSPINNQITSIKLPIENINMGEKYGHREIPKLINNYTEALYFDINRDDYYGRAIEDYLDELTQYSFFKYVVIGDREKRFLGITDARNLNLIFKNPSANFDSRDFAFWINSSNIDSLKKLPGYIDKGIAIRSDEEKSEALEKMEELNVDILPVIDERSQLIGIVDRERLIASLIIDVTNKVK